ncbi:unnamed protein product [Ectocarpus fasciculatus]
MDRQNLARAFAGTRKSQSTSAISVSDSKLARTYSEREARGSHGLLQMIERGTVDDVRTILSKTQPSDKSILTAPSLEAEHFQRTPLMAAVERGDLPIFTALLHYVDRLFSTNENLKCAEVGDLEHCPQLERDRAMRMQLAAQDNAGATVTMLAARKGNVAILSVILAEIQHTHAKRSLEASDYEGRTVLLYSAMSGSAPVFRAVLHAMEVALRADEGGVGIHLTRQSDDGRNILMHSARAGSAMALRTVANIVRRGCDPQTVRHLLYQTDAEGLNFLMHSVACRICPPAPVRGGENLGVSSSGSALPAASEDNIQHKRASSIGESSVLGLRNHVVLPPDPAVPVFNVAFEFVQCCLWKAQLRDHLTATDLSGRTLLVHSIRSKHSQLFEAALGAIRKHVLDAEVLEMLETTEDELDHTPLRSALVEGGEEMQNRFEKRRHHLKADVGKKSKLSTIEAKIQSFIPGKLIVIFQLLLPVTQESDQLYLLVFMCILAPLFNWANSLLLKEKPVAENPAAVPRRSVVSLLLGCPALFFWGIGTSDIGLTFGWGPSRSAAALAVATIIVPATDAFFNSKSVELWYEQWSCQKKRFVDRANRKWRQNTTKPLEKGYELVSKRHHEIGHLLRHSAAPPDQFTQGEAPSWGGTVTGVGMARELTPPMEGREEKV